MCNVSLPLETKNQVTLPKEDHVTKLIVCDYQSIYDHSSNEHILALIREFWILQRSSTIKSVFSKCVSCCCRQAPLTTEITHTVFAKVRSHFATWSIQGKKFLSSVEASTKNYADIFWRRLSREYLPLLQLRLKWVHPRRD